MTNNTTLKDLEPTIKKAADIIKKAIDERSLIILRHHADCDGYCGALAIEEVILPIIQKENMKAWQKYKRLPMKAPYYDYSDALKDLSNFQLSIASNRKPLLIIVDNGCGEEDLLALKRIKQYNVDVLIIDHHVYSEEVEKRVDVFLNPRTITNNGDVTAGMLGYEVAKRIGDPNNIYPALSGVADKSSQEIVDHYARLSGHKKEFLEELALCVDFEAYNLSFMESDMIYDLFNEKQERMMKLLLPSIKEKTEEYKVITKKFVVRDKNVFWLDINKVSSYGEYPTPGKIVGIAHRLEQGKRITLGLADDFITFRVDGMNFSVKEVIESLRKKIPHGKINGGGHDYAGTIKFIPAVKEEVKKVMKEYIKRKNENKLK
ncbi:MAG: hypothetical protein KJ583_00835 [Nanoarchaeota archaeon]|nr:hypothetical protein [Nanoarchaeota archaeon]MBU1270158.1 hypothetical protein [Nanoarchaeota archaeon]MBU1603835.1 hypothetical protein [Nanoarchaeota archaeon]MBU2443301.1 hypothetical protein [Nanoarchaeota archaeon]